MDSKRQKQCGQCKTLYPSKAHFCHLDGARLHLVAPPSALVTVADPACETMPLAPELAGAAPGPVADRPHETGPRVARRRVQAVGVPPPLAHVSEREMYGLQSPRRTGRTKPMPPAEPPVAVRAAGLPPPVPKGRIVLAVATLLFGVALIIGVLAAAFSNPELRAATPDRPEVASGPAEPVPAPEDVTPVSPAAVSAPAELVEVPPPAPSDAVPAPPRPAPARRTVARARRPQPQRAVATKAAAPRRVVVSPQLEEERLKRAKKARKEREKRIKEREEQSLEP